MVSDHVAITSDVAERYPAPFFDTAATLGWLAANTTTIELGTTVMLLPLRHVLDTAKIVGTVDQLSGGRMTAFGVGLGWAKGEFEALGVPFERRGAITDDYLAALRELWSSDLASYDGAYAGFSGVQTAPRPSSTTRIWVGGMVDAGLRRAVRYGDAWHPISFTLDSLAERVERLRAIADEEKRPAPMLAPRIRLSLTERPLGADRAPGEGTLDQIHGDLATIEALGAAYVVFDPFPPAVNGHAVGLAEIERAAAQVIELR
jgi:probable F420-dependent oxidoreductase